MSIFLKKNYLAAISGGPDSIALLHMYRHHIKVVCTVKYNKRQNCDFDVECVRKLCQKYQINHEILDVTNEIYDKYSYIKNFQTKARMIRYDFFSTIAKQYNIKKIIVAHHLDDFLESGYLDIIKKSKKFYYGIKQKNNYQDLFIYRPLINKYRKQTLKRYCDDLKLEYAIDESNFSDIYERNKIRKIIQSFPKTKIYDLLQKIRAYNKKNKHLQYKITKLFLDWKKTNYCLNYLSNISTNYKYHLIYNFLIDNSIYRPSQNKINAIISFLNSESKNKLFRLENNQYLTKKNNKFELIKK